jgi:hypothetical protein
MTIASSEVCTRCKGTGTRTSPAFDQYPERTYACHCCDGKGSFPAVDVQAIAQMITAGKGDKQRFRKSWPSKLTPYRTNDVTVRRAYYVWRLARFHGGADVTMPMTADMVNAGDPFKPVLDHLSDVVAKRVFGTDMAAANRWGSLLGFSKGSTPGLPASAYEGGPVVTEGVKPAFEAAEIE